MVLFSIGLPSRFSEWCDALLRHLVERGLESAEAVGVNGLEDLAAAAIRSNAAHLVACSRAPVSRLRNEIARSQRPFLLALGEPRAAVRRMFEHLDNVADATRVAACSCAAMVELARLPHALVVGPSDGRSLRQLAEAIVDHFALPLDPSEVQHIADQFTAIDLPAEETDTDRWWERLSEREQETVTGALQAYAEYFVGHEIDRLVWQPDLFYIGEEPISSALVPASRPADLTGRPRFVLYGPFLNLPAGPWLADVVLGFSAEAADMSLTVEVFAGDRLASTRIEVVGEQVIETRLGFTIEDSLDQPVQIRVATERAAFDGRIVIGYAAMQRQAMVPEETRQRLANAVRREVIPP
jgi:hypothetical protein